MNKDCAEKYKCMNQIDNNLFLLTDKSSELIMCDLTKKNRYFIGKIQRPNSYFSTSCVIGTKVYYFSYFGNEFCVFDSEKKKLRFVKADMESQGKRIGECSSCTKYKDSIYVICGPNSIQLIKIDSLTDNVRTCADWVEEGQKKYGCVVYPTLFCNPCIINDTMWLPTNIPDVLIKYYMDSDTYEFIELKKNNIVYNTIMFDGNNLWLSGNANVLIKLNNMDPSAMEVYALSGDILIRESILRKFLFYTAYVLDKYIYYLPLQSNCLIRVETGTGTIEIIKKFDGDDYCFLSSDIVYDTKPSVCMQIENDLNDQFSLNICVDLEYDKFVLDDSDMTYSEAVNVKQNTSTAYLEKDNEMLSWFIQSVIE